MLPTVSEKSAEPTVIINTDGNSAPRPNAQIKASYKKYIIIAVAVVAVVAVAVGGTLGAVHLSHNAVNDVWKEYSLRVTDKDGKEREESVKVDVKDNITVYNVKSEQFHVAMDNSRGLVVYKMEMNNKVACYLTPMNTSDEVDSKDVANAMENADTAKDAPEDDGDQTRFVADTSPIKDKSFLSPRMQEFCKDLEAYWLTKTNNGVLDGTSTPTPAGKVRQKRRICYYRSCRRIRCSYFIRRIGGRVTILRRCYIYIGICRICRG